jgi:hypothetical protein
MDIPYFMTSHEFDKPLFVFGREVAEGESADDILVNKVFTGFEQVTDPGGAFGLIFCSFSQAQMLLSICGAKEGYSAALIFVSRGEVTGPHRAVAQNQLPRNTVETAVLIKRGNADWASFAPFALAPGQNPTNLGNLFTAPDNFEKYPQPTNLLPFRKPADLLAKFLEGYSVVDRPVVEAFSGKF